MGTLTLGLGWAVCVAALLRRVLRQFDAYSVGSLQPGQQAGAATVAVIVPARDEAENIGPCLQALAAQSYPSLQIIAVDDGSQDGTFAQIAQLSAHDARIQSLTAGTLPPGWLGKPHACQVGAAQADAAWLCFVDADVRAEPGLLAVAVAAAETRGLDLLSVHPTQLLVSFWERLIMPAGMLMIACAKPPAGPAEDVAVNGQFLLIRQEVYRAVGGHRAVRREVCEDTALARRIARAGHRVAVLAGERLARTRMYRDLPSLWEGFSKNAVDILGSAPRTRAVACAALLVGWAALLLPIVAAASAVRAPGPAALSGLALAAAGSLTVFGVYAGTLRHFRAPLLLTPLLPLGITLAAALGWRSAGMRRQGRVRWKGRTYLLAGLADPS